MNYDEFKNVLQEKIQSNFLQQIDFISHIVHKTNETLDALTLHFAGQDVSCTIYPEKMYTDYKNGMSISAIANNVAAAVTSDRYPNIPEITPENAEKSISFSLINAEKNKNLLQNCPYHRVHDMAAVPRWHLPDGASFLVNNSLMQTLKMTKEEILDIAQKNTETAEYTCKGINEVIREIMKSDGMDDEFLDEMLPTQQIPFYIVTNQSGADGSCAVLSDSFMQKVAGKIGSDEIYMLPSSRHEMIAVNPDVIADTPELKAMVMSVNSNPDIIKKEDFLSDSVYKYNAQTHSISVCDSNGLFPDRTAGMENIKPAISKGRTRV